LFWKSGEPALAKSIGTDTMLSQSDPSIHGAEAKPGVLAIAAWQISRKLLI